jgi:two-component system, OmpR family, sensor histidine kinase SenX3
MEPFNSCQDLSYVFMLSDSRPVAPRVSPPAMLFPMPLASASSSGTVIVYVAIGVGALIAIVLANVLGRRSGRLSLEQRLSALGSRLGIETSNREARRGVEHALIHIEQGIERATEAMEESSSEAIRLRRALDTLPQGVIVCDENGEDVFRNARADAMMGGRHGDALAAQAVKELLAEAWQRGSAMRVLDLYGPPRRTLNVRTQVIDDGRRTLGVIAVIDDVSERRRLEEIRRDFVANVSHELKTPMGALGLLAETLVAERDQSVASRLAARIHTEAFRVSRVIDDLLDLTRIEAEEAPPREPVLISLVMAEALERVREAADQRGVKISLEEPQKPVSVPGDRRQLVSAMYNLLENAVKFSYDGNNIEFGALVKDDHVEITVVDHGVGIPARDLDRIFERFYRVDQGRSRQTGGTGLGLSIVRHVAANHQGRVEVESREGEGSTFRLTLPAQSE